MTTDIKPPTVTVSELLIQVDDGRAHTAASLALAELVAAVDATGRKGTVTIKLTCRKEGTIAAVGVEIATKIPRTPTREELYHFAGGGELSKEDPRQLKLPKIGPTGTVKP